MGNGPPSVGFDLQRLKAGSCNSQQDSGYTAAPNKSYKHRTRDHVSRDREMGTQRYICHSVFIARGTFTHHLFSFPILDRNPSRRVTTQVVPEDGNVTFLQEGSTFLIVYTSSQTLMWLYLSPILPTLDLCFGPDCRR